MIDALAVRCSTPTKLLLVLTWASISFAGDTYVPPADDVVLETLPQSLWGTRDKLVAFQTRLKENPNDALLAYQIANFFVEAGDQGADPRFYGFAQSALEPWWTSQRVPPPILRLRAKLKEKEHRYSEAIADLRLLTRARPKDGQALIELANLYRLTGDYEMADDACRRLTRFAAKIPVAICRVPLDGLTGNAEKGLQTLEELLPNIESDFPATMAWVRMTQAELSEILGRDDDAVEYYQLGLAESPQSLSMKRAFSDRLIQDERYEQAWEVVKESLTDEGCLLMAAIAKRHLGDESESKRLAVQLQQRFTDTRQRGDKPHGRFVARYLLDLADDPKTAMIESLDNWAQQKELVDARLVLRSAIESNQPKLAAPVIEFLKNCKSQDNAALALIDQLERQ